VIPALGTLPQEVIMKDKPCHVSHSIGYFRGFNGLPRHLEFPAPSLNKAAYSRGYKRGQMIAASKKQKAQPS
jgi:hypothetical protein